MIIAGCEAQNPWRYLARQLTRPLSSSGMVPVVPTVPPLGFVPVGFKSGKAVIVIGKQPRSWGALVVRNRGSCTPFVNLIVKLDVLRILKKSK